VRAVHGLKVCVRMYSMPPNCGCRVCHILRWMYSMPPNCGCRVCHILRWMYRRHVPLDVHYATFNGGCTDARQLWIYTMPHLTLDGRMSHLSVQNIMRRISGRHIYHPYAGTPLSVCYSSSHTLKQPQLKNFCHLWLLSFLIEPHFNHLTLNPLTWKIW